MADIDIKTLLPQREPFLFVDELHYADTGESIGVKTYDETFPYYIDYSANQKIVPGGILIESLVQCGGAGVNKAGIAEPVLWGLASIEKARFCSIVTPNSTTKMVVKNLKISSKILKQTGVSYCRGEVVLEATWCCLRFKEARWSK